MIEPMKLSIPYVLFLAIPLLLGGCSTLRPHSPPPAAVEAQVRMPGLAGVRAWGDEFSPEFQQDVIESIRREQSSGLIHEGETVDILAISGGGGDGAYGAGLLCGWTAAGDRPRFKLVTGISTGALTAPFTFLGPDYDAKLKKVYTSIQSSDIFQLKPLFGIFEPDAIGRNDPLAKLTAEYVDERMLKDIAAEHAKGRRLYIGTTALDAQRPVIWNMGAIAASGHPEALALFRQIMIASAAVPVAFPPVYLTVEADGKRYDEMHVDGGVTNQVFLYGPVLDPMRMTQALGFDRRRRQVRVYVIRNTQVKAHWQAVKPRIRSIAPRSVSSLIKAQGIGDLYRIYSTARRDGLDFNLAVVPDQMETSDRADEFDNRIMNVLFDTGYTLARHGYRWRKEPPGYFAAEQENTAGK
jgi:hypothetical protein